MDEDEYFMPPRSLDVLEDDDTFRPQPTGVLNAKGRMIYREPERIGFRLKKERR